MDNYWVLKKTFPCKKNHEVVGVFLLNLKLQNRSRETIVLYRQFLERFFEDKIDSFSALTSESIHQWLVKNKGHVKETTFIFYLNILSSFYDFCVKEEHMKQTPVKRRWFPRLPQPIPKYLEREDIAKTRQYSEKMSLRNQVMIEFMLTSGCRVGEMRTLDRKDVDIENRIAYVMGKGRKVRHVHFSERCAILLERYIASLPEGFQALFVTTTGKRLNIRTIQWILNEIGKGAGLSASLHPHRLRHTFATELLAKGAELSFISEELGHSDLGTTRIYARLPKREIIAMYRKYMG
ncbi:tyrosine-type recombinase/integrase [Cytobacillus oceanisediminis]|uniref:tyrosine-type recombinase/integrase n=1 Tax=Cytobacillus oceanisediminis TaxID=665099 RepID=UPI00254A8B9D|nr:tyrosine-type recombinase/integrase [Cytobacillus oceanisediminis]MDK7669181.1 tyrosine-type recombinase/integrase [Cytobacillus oceanisediminis]